MNVRRSLLALILIAGLVVPAASEDIKDMLPQEAIVSIWFRNVPELLEGIKRFVPPLANELPDAVELLAEGGFPAEAAALPMAMVVLAPSEENPYPEPILLFSTPKANEFFRQMDDLGGGIFEHPDERLYLMRYKGQIAASRDEESLEAFLALEGGPYVPNKDSKAILDNALVYINFNVTTALQLMRDEMEDELGAMQDNPDMAVALKMLEFADQVTSIDGAFKFDEQGLMMEMVASTVDDSVVKQYAKPGPATNLAKPRVLQLENFFFYDSSNIYQLLNEVMLKEGLMKFFLEMAEQQGTMPEMDIAALIKANEELLAEQLEIFGTQVSNVMALTPAGLQFVQVQEVRRPERVAAYIQKSIEVAKAAPGWDLDFAYDPDFTTIDGVKVGKVQYDFAKIPLPLPQKTADSLMKGITELLKADKVIINSAVVDGYHITAIGDGVMERQIALMRGKGDEKAVTDDPTAKQMIAKIGTDHKDITLVSPVRSLELVTRFLAAALNKPAPFALPYSTPVAMGIDFGEEAPLKFKMYIPQSCITEIMVAGMSASNIFQEAFMNLFMGGMGGGMGGDWGDADDEDWDWN